MTPWRNLDGEPAGKPADLHGDGPPQAGRGRRQHAKAALQGLAVLLLCTALARAALASLGFRVSVTVTRLHEAPPPRPPGPGSGPGSGAGPGPDPHDAAPAATAPKANVWAPISSADNAAVWAWLHDPARGLNLTAPERAGINDNYVAWVDTLPVNKTAALACIDGGGPAPAPYARVLVFAGGQAEPEGREYMVGPLPVGPATGLAPLDYPYNGGMGGAVPYNARGVDVVRARALDALVGGAMAEVADVTRALLGGGAAYYGAGDNRSTLVTSAGTPLSFDGSQAHAHIVFHFPGPAHYLLPLDFFLLVDWPGTDTSLWSARGFVTKGRFLPDAAALRAAFDAGELAPEHSQRADYDWALAKYQPGLGERPLERRAAPAGAEVGGKRYAVDEAERYVEYMGWSFYVTHTRTLGPQFQDVRFRGERILYELSLQEAASQYGGFQPKAASTVYHDAAFSLGTDIFPLVEGFDCPVGSTFWNMTFFEANRTVVHPRAVCLFEQDAGRPLSRHRAGAGRPRENEAGGDGEPGGEDSNPWGFVNLGVVRDAALHVRFVATVGNYDYLFDYAFGLGGALEVSVRASGYLMASPYYADQTGRFGPRIQRATQGSLHDHVLTFKADFDVVDAANRLTKTTLAAVAQTQPWFAHLGEFEQLQLRTATVATEQPLHWEPNQAALYTVVHANATNAWGMPRGYRLVPGHSNVHLGTPRSPWSRRSMEFAKSPLAVTRQHDTEPWANSIHNANLPWRPQQDFARFFDGEGLDGEDLVVWFNLGMHHLTRAEDVPVTLFSEAVSSMTFAPDNFFDRAQDGDLRNRRWIVPDPATGALAVDDYGVAPPQGLGDAPPVDQIYVTEP